MPTPIDLKNLTQPQLAAFFAQVGLPASRVRHVFALVHRPGTHGFSGMKTVRREIRELLAGQARISRLEPAKVQRSTDGTVKFAFRLHDGATIESVLIPTKGRHTLCVSSQAGCAMGCRFCLTAGMGLRRNLTPAEIVNQVVAVQEHLIGPGVVRATTRQLVDNLVFMGMGEPLANYDNLIAALTILMDQQGQGFSERRVTVSTCGLVPRIRDLARDIRVNLAVSLHAADDATRSALMPVNRTHGVDNLLASCREYAAATKQVVFVEYALIAGCNDAESDAHRLAEKLRDLPCRVNLLSYNEVPNLSYRCSPETSIRAFKGILANAGFRTLVRTSRGADISAACGQLAANESP
ncbi:MAG: 23S rRNA (adenine(2503)-C(2))-methyltransferase RlmN [Candidatus Methylomirabilia bacterium]